MKAILFCISLMIISGLQIKANILTAIKSGKWHQGTNWDLGRIPCTGDTLIIPDGITIIASDNIRLINSNKDDGKLVIFGELKLNRNVSLIIGDIQWISCLENGKLTGDSGAKIIAKEQTKFRFKHRNEKFVMENKKPEIMIQRFNIRLNDTLLTDFSIRNSDSLTFIEVQHSYDGKSWKIIDRVKAFPNEANECRFISLSEVARQDNVDFIRLIGYSNVGEPVLINISQFKHNSKKIENRNKLNTIPKTVFIFSLVSVGTRFAKMMNTF